MESTAKKLNPETTREAIALGATLVAQAKGDVTGARTMARQAHDWLCVVDPEFVAAPVLTLAPAPVVYDPVDGLPIDMPELPDAKLAEQARLTAEAWAQATWAAERADRLESECNDLRVALERSEAECERRGNAGATDRERLAEAREKLTEAAAKIARLEAKLAKLEAADAKSTAVAEQVIARMAAPVARVASAAAYDAAMRAPVAPAAAGEAVRPASVDAARWEAMSPAMRAFVAKSAK